jgi:hypothetical protein
MLLLIFGSSYLQANISIVTKTLPNGTVNTPYSAVIATTGGCSPATWAISSGTLPAGVAMKPSINPISLSLTGTPTKAATSSFTVKVTGCGGVSSTQSYTATIQPTPNHVVDLSWQASTSKGVTGYNIYRSPDGVAWQQLNVSLIASTLYTDSTVSNGSTYYYAVTAEDINGFQSIKSTSIKVTIP